MKIVKLIVFFYGVFIVGVNAQTFKTIDLDLTKGYKRILYWKDKRGDMNNYDSVVKANAFFIEKLKFYTRRYPFTIRENYKSLAQPGINIISNGDNKLRVYSWNTLLGYEYVDFDNIFQYKVGDETFWTLEIGRDDAEHKPRCYFKINTMAFPEVTYYLAYYFIQPNKSMQYEEGVQCFVIDRGKLDQNLKLFKFDDNYESHVFYNYTAAPFVNRKGWPQMHFDGNTNTLFIPVAINGKLTKKLTAYKFTGQYFERVKKLI